MVSPVHGDYRRCQAEIPLIVLFRFPGPALCAYFGSEQLKECVEIDPKIRGGVPVLKGTRFTVSETLAELAESDAIDDVADNFDLEQSKIKDLLNGLSLLLNCPFPR